VWNQIISALAAAGVSYVPGSLLIGGAGTPEESDNNVLIGVPIGVSLGVLFLVSIVAVRCFQKRKPGARTPHLRPHGRRWSRLPHAAPLPSSSPPSALCPVRRRVGQARGGRQHLLLGFLHQLQIEGLPKRLKMHGSMGLYRPRARPHGPATIQLHWTTWPDTAHHTYQEAVLDSAGSSK